MPKAQQEGAIPLRRIDVVVPVRNEALLLRGKLESICSQSFPTELIDVIVVDSSSDDSVKEVVEEISRKHEALRVNLLKDRSGRGKYSALNLAFQFCKSDLLIITDVDVETDNDAFERILSDFKDPRIGAVSAMETVESRFGDVSAYRGLYNRLRIAESSLDSVIMCESNFSAYRRQLIDQLPDDTQCDDLALTTAVLSKGRRAIYDPRVLFRENQEGFKTRDVLSQKLRRARANIHGLLAATAVKSGYSKTQRRLLLPFEIFLHVIGPLLMALFLVFLVLFGLEPGNASIAVSSGIALGLMGIIAGSLLNTRSVRGKGLLWNLRMSLNTLKAFLEYNLILLTALMLVLVQGPQTKWDVVRTGERVFKKRLDSS